MWKEPLNKKTCKFYAIRSYRNGLGWADFFSDLKILNNINPHLKEYKDIRTTLNKLINLGNVFKEDSLARLLFFFSFEENYSQTKTFLQFMHRLPENIPEVNIKDIKINKELLDKLKNI